MEVRDLGEQLVGGTIAGIGAVEVRERRPGGPHEVGGERPDGHSLECRWLAPPLGDLGATDQVGGHRRRLDDHTTYPCAVHDTGSTRTRAGGETGEESRGPGNQRPSSVVTRSDDLAADQGPSDRRTRLLALLLLATLAAACGGSTFDDAAFDTAQSGDAVSSEPSRGFVTDAAGPAEAAFDDVEEAEFESTQAANGADFDGDAALDTSAMTTGSAGAPPVAQLPDIGRDIVYTAWLELGATDVSAATRDAIRTIEGLGGFLFSQETRGGTGGSSVLVFKILPDQFQRAVGELGSLGSVRSQSVSAEDVTDLVVDLQSRIITAEASVARLQDFLADADSIEVIASLEGQLLERETTLERLRGQLRSVRNRVDLATINVNVVELANRPGLSLSVAAYRGHDAGFNCVDAHRVDTIEADTPVTICYQLSNIGDTDLVDLTIDDPVLGATLGDLVVVEGSVTGLAPGETLVIAHEVEVAESLRMRTSATAIALDADGVPLDDEVMATAPRLRVDVLDDGANLPGFGEVLRDSWNVLATVAVVAALALVAATPFLALALLIAPLLWMVLRRARPRAKAMPNAPDAPASPPEAPSVPDDAIDAKESTVSR